MALSYGAAAGYTVEMAGPFGSIGSSGKITQITLPAADWKGGESPFFQNISVAGISEASLVQIQATKEQTAALCESGTALHIENDSGVTTAWAIGTKPHGDLTLQLTVTEVVSA